MVSDVISFHLSSRMTPQVLGIGVYISCKGGGRIKAGTAEREAQSKSYAFSINVQGPLGARPRAAAQLVIRLS